MNAPLDIHAVAAARKAIAIWKAWDAEETRREAALALLNHAMRVVRDAFLAEHSYHGVTDADRAIVSAVTAPSPLGIPPVVSPEAMPEVMAWLAHHHAAVVPGEPDYRQPFDDAGYVIVALGFDVTMQELVALDNPSDSDIWALIEPAILSRAAHWDRRRAA